MKKTIICVLLSVLFTAFAASAQIDWAKYAGKYEMTTSTTDGGQNGVPQITITQTGVMTLEATGAVKFDGSFKTDVNLSMGEPATILTLMYTLKYAGVARAVSHDTFVIKADKESVKLDFKDQSVENSNEMVEAMIPVFKESIGYMSGEIKRELGDREARYTVSKVDGEFVVTDGDGVVWTVKKLD